MAGLADLVQSMIAVASDVTSDFQAVITIKPFTGQNGFGDDTFGAPVSVNALVNLETRQRYSYTGKLIVVAATLTVLDPIAANGTVTVPPRHEPVDPRDKVTLDNGFTAPIVETQGFENAATKAPFLNVIVLGRVVSGN